jgi:hypothetical protein
MVVDLAVEDDVARAVLVGHRLLAARAIDDRQPPVAERDVNRVVEAVAIGAAVRDCRVHRRHGCARIGMEPAVECEDPADAAHISDALLRGRR